jgi:hypothetical protein
VREVVDGNLPTGWTLDENRFIGSTPSPEDALNIIRNTVDEIDFWGLAQYYDNGDREKSEVPLVAAGVVSASGARRRARLALGTAVIAAGRRAGAGARRHRLCSGRNAAGGDDLRRTGDRSTGLRTTGTVSLTAVSTR